MPIIETRRLSKYYIDKKKKTATAALFEIDLKLEKNSFNVLVGPSGCGKTTLLKTLAGIYEPDDGEIYVDNTLVNQNSPIQRDVAFVAQDFRLYPNMTVFDNIAYPLKLQKINPEEITKRVKELASILDIEFFLSRKPKTLSGGQQQRVALARAMIRQTSILLLDEPLSNIDQKLHVDLLKKIKDWQKTHAITLLYVTHQLPYVSNLANRIFYMENGSIKPSKAGDLQ